MAERVHAVSVDFPIKFTPQRNFRLLLTLCHGQGWPVGRFEIKLVLQSLHTRGRSRNWGCWRPGCGTKLAMNLHGAFSLKQPERAGERRKMWCGRSHLRAAVPSRLQLRSLGDPYSGGGWETEHWAPAELTLLLRPSGMHLSKCQLTNATLFLFSHPTRRKKVKSWQ